MSRLHILSVFLLLSWPAASPAQEWRRASEYDVLLSSYDIEPKTIHLKAGEPVRLRFVNNSNRRHDFSAESFFARSKLRARDARLVARGLKVDAGDTLTIALVPQSGRYRMKSGNFLRRLMGMSGAIIVE